VCLPSYPRLPFLIRVYVLLHDREMGLAGGGLSSSLSLKGEGQSSFCFVHAEFVAVFGRAGASLDDDDLGTRVTSHSRR